MGVVFEPHLNVLWSHNVLLAPYSTYKIGGPAKLFFKASTLSELQSALYYCKIHNIDYYLLGRGSNTLFDDRGFDGAVIINALSGFTHHEDIFDVSAGTPLVYFSLQSTKLGYSGLEYAIGIPGSVGGAVFMNAGAAGQEIKDVIISASFLDEDLKLQTMNKESLKLEYRKSIFHSMKATIISAQFKLQKDLNAKARQQDMLHKRKTSQPLDEPSCGCTFQNGDDFIAGQLIDELGLKGTQIGDAQISGQHANFIVNKGQAKAEDVKALVKLVEKIVFEKTGYQLHREIRYVPYRRGDV